jgi:hypothetical protein
MEYHEIRTGDLKDEFLMRTTRGKIVLVIHAPNAGMYVEDINAIFKIAIEEEDEIEFVFIECNTLKEALDRYDMLVKGEIDGKYCQYDIWDDGRRARSTDDP